jgi:hypothetical protein
MAHAVHVVEDHASNEILPRGEVAVHRGIADARPCRDLIERSVRSELEDQLPPGRDDLVSVALRIRPHIHPP